MTRTGLLVISVSFLFAGCRNGNTHQESGNILNYPDFIAMTADGSDFCATVLNPWKKGAVLRSYRLDTDGNADLDASGNECIIHIPATRLVIMTSCHARLVSELGYADAIAGVCEPESISDTLICRMLKEGRITDCGNSMYPDIEKIMDLQPDAILVSPFEESGYGQLEKLGIPIVECADYMETSPLGRAEWMRFYGRLIGAGSNADSLFRRVEEEYLALCGQAAESGIHPKVMVDTKGGSAWYVPGGHSTVGIMINNAGGKYLFEEDDRSGSIPYSFETVYEKAAEADIWLLKNSSEKEMTYESLESDFKPYAMFRPFRERKIWVCDVYRVPYFEEIPFHPEALLRDYIGIFSGNGGNDIRYYHPLGTSQVP